MKIREKYNRMYTIKSDSYFFEKFQSIENRIKELSNVFQNEYIEVSDVEYIEWNTIARQLQIDLTQLIYEGKNKFVWNKQYDDYDS